MRPKPTIPKSLRPFHKRPLGFYERHEVLKLVHKFRRLSPAGKFWVRSKLATIPG